MNKWNKLGIVLFLIPIVSMLVWAFHMSFLEHGLMNGIIYPICAVLIVMIWGFTVVSLMSSKK